ncbi:S26 family signal peptidase [Croceicoccus bisphenolivorans]|uniref:S26 family signal peptidase n=1 Tax=Croceicoccus bisphenolivorans TaxID=1783232 RepID=UPI0008377F19|nr:S26 family signal peptidase [Croceicoccus bisphenolivorans]
MPHADSLRPHPEPCARRTWPRLALLAGLGAGALALTALHGFAKSHALMINASPSLPHWAIWLDKDTAPTRGMIVLFAPPPSELLSAHFGEKPQPFGKRVLGMPGDVVTRQGRTFAINGEVVATAKPKSRKGEALALGPTGTIPAGCYYVGTDHPDSFDSRYAAIGWICENRILGVGRPIL